MKSRGTPIKTVYYRDELSDEFSEAVITPKKIDGSYRYLRRGFFARLAHIFFYRVIAIPLAFCYLKIKFRHRIIGREKLRPYKKTARFIYGNHTQPTADALIPTFITHPENAYVIVHPANVSMPVLGRVTPYIGALPLPDGLAAVKNFNSALDTLVSSGSPVYIYPEAHIWPYYTGIRPFGDRSFMYPVKYGTPVFCFTNVYKKRKHGKSPTIVTYIDGPFFPDKSLPRDKAREALRCRVLSAMRERAALSDCEYIRYLPVADERKI